MVLVLPVLDLADADRDAGVFRSQLREAAHGIGFFYLVGHGVPDAQIDEVLGLAWMFFALAAGARTRADLAAEFLPEFGVSTECGLGRHSPEQLEAVLVAWQQYSAAQEPALVS